MVTVSGTPFWVWGDYDPSKEQKKHYYDYPTQEEMFFHHYDPNAPGQKRWTTKEPGCVGSLYGWSTGSDYGNIRPFTEEAFAIEQPPTRFEGIREKFGLGEYGHKAPCTKKEAEILQAENEQFWTGGWGSAPQTGQGQIPSFGIAGLGGGIEAGLGGNAGISKLGVGAGTTAGSIFDLPPWHPRGGLAARAAADFQMILAGLNTMTFGIPGKLRESVMGEEYRIPTWTPKGLQYGVFFPGVSTGVTAGIGAGATGAMAGIAAGTKKDEISGLGTTGIMAGIGAGVQTPWWHEETPGWGGVTLPGWPETPGWGGVTLPGWPDINIPEFSWPWGGNGGGGGGTAEDGGMSLWTKLGIGLLALGAIYILAKSAPSLAKARKISKTKRKKEA